jgi:polysaccharide pyruvyl transferase CsaB
VIPDLVADPDSRQDHAEQRPVLLCGYYGEHNLGDDALLEALLALLPDGIQPLVTAHDQEQVRRRFGVATLQRRSLMAVLGGLRASRALVFGGGSLLQDSTSFRSLLYYALLIASARLQGKPVLLWAQGLGPLRRRRSRLLVRSLLASVSGCTWRDPDSAALAVRLGLQAPAGADAVWSLPPGRWHGRGGPIVLCWRPTPLLQGQAWRPYLEAVELLAEQQDRDVIWLPFHGAQDRSLLQQLSAEGLLGEPLQRRSRVVEVERPEEAIGLFASAGLVLAMRLHALILAGLAGAPLAALSYDPKVQACAAGLDCPWVDLSDPAEASNLLISWQRSLDQPTPAAVIAAQRDSARVHAELLRTLAP